MIIEYCTYPEYIHISTVLQQTTGENTTQNITFLQVSTTPNPTSSEHKKRKIGDSQDNLSKTNPTTLNANSQHIPEYDAFGVYISKKLSRMEPKQAVYAEFLISSIIRRGLLTQLTENTDFYEKPHYSPTDSW